MNMPDLIKASYYKRAIWATTKLVILLGLMVFIYLKLQDRRDVSETTLKYIETTIQSNSGLLILVLALMPLNWGLEAMKWRTLVKPIATMSFLNAIKGVLTGLSLSFMTPHGLGDYFGRVMQANSPQRGRYIGAILLGRLCQMIPTLLFGSLGLYYVSSNAGLFYVISAAIFCAVIFTIYSIRRGDVLISKITLPEKLRSKVNYYFGIIGSYPAVAILKVLMFSILRYLVFAVQFGIILFLFLPEIDIHLNAAGVTWIFLSKSVLPTFNFLSDIGVREFSAIYFYDKYNVDLVAVVSASLTLWLINILVPTIVGAPLTLKMKLRAR